MRLACLPRRNARSPISPSTSDSPTSPTSCAPSIAPPGFRHARFARRQKESARFSKIGSLHCPKLFSSHTEDLMYDHIGLKVKNLETSVRFYTAALAPLGHVLGSTDKSYAGIGPEDAPGLWLYAASGAAGTG